MKNQITNKKPIQPILNKEQQFGFLFTKMNFTLMIVGIIFLALGYILMVGGKASDVKVFNEEIFNTQRLVIAPILLIIGIIIELIAIMYHPKKNNISEQ